MGGRDYYLVGIAFLVMASFLYSWDLADFISLWLNLYLLSLQLEVRGLNKYLLGVGLEVSGDPLLVAGGVVVVGKAEAQAKG